MASNFEISYEIATGVTDAAAATFVALLSWTQAVVILRRRAPHGLELKIPLDGTHHLTDFTAAREIRIKRDGVWWWAGFMDAPRLPGGSKGREIVLPGWGNAYALTLQHNTPFAGSAGLTLGATWDADSGLASILDQAEHFTGTDWFPSAGRTIGAAGTSMTSDLRLAGLSPLDACLQLADIEGWPVRCGIDASGAFTFKSSGAIDQDLTGSVHLYDGASGVAITDYAADGHAICSQVHVVCRMPNVRTQLNGALGAGATTITVDATAGLQPGDIHEIGTGTANKEQVTVNTITSGTVYTLTGGGTSFTHADNDLVQTLTDGRFRLTTVTAAGSVQDAHHLQEQVIFNDQLVSDAMRTAYGDAYLAAYDHKLVQVTYRVTNGLEIEALLAAGLHPGDSIKATSDHSELGLVYNNTTATVQELALTLTKGVCTQIDLTLGDPALDALAVLDRQLAGARNASVAVYG